MRVPRGGAREGSMRHGADETHTFAHKLHVDETLLHTAVNLLMAHACKVEVAVQH